MRFGIQSAFHTGSVDLVEFSAKCEALGFESIWLPEHTVIPVNPSVGPGGVAGAPIPDSYLLMTDPLIGLTVAAGATSILKLGTAVCLIPEHHPIDLAKHISSLDFYSGGRFILGAGAGWQPEESAAMGGDFKRRWAQTVESLEIMKKLWTQDATEHSGHYYQFPPVKFHPKPVQQPNPPILLGGTSKRVFTRAATLANGWAPWMASPEIVAEGKRELHAAFAKAGRDPESSEITVFVSNFEPDMVNAYEAAGADRLVCVIRSEPETNPHVKIEELAGGAGL